MKNLVSFCTLILFLASCSNVVFVSPQPENVDVLIKIPEKYHGIYEFEDTSINPDSYLVTDSSVGEFVLGDSLIVKQRGSYFYLNFLEENAYEVYVVRINQSLSYENIEMLFPNISEHNEHLFNIIDTKGQAGFPSMTNKSYLIDNVSVNQMNVLLHQPIYDDIVTLKRIK